MYLDKSRIDCILIWGHGLEFYDNIIEDINDNNNFKILKIVKHKPKSINKLIKEIYSFDYAPFWHLKAKTRYLKKTKKEVCFIFVENFFPEEDFLDDGKFRHKESLTLKNFKECLRDKYNPRANGQRSHDHVIHATDSEEQSDLMLKYLGYPRGISILNINNSNNFIEIPYYLEGANNFVFLELNIDDIYCTIIKGNSWDSYYTEIDPIVESPQFKGLTIDSKYYTDYIAKFIGGPLQENYSIDRFLNLSESFNYLETPYETSFVLVEEIDEKFVVVDGLHRVCSHIAKGYRKIKVCKISKKKLI